MSALSTRMYVTKEKKFLVLFSFVNSILGSYKTQIVNENRNEYKASLLPTPSTRVIAISLDINGLGSPAWAGTLRSILVLLTSPGVCGQEPQASQEIIQESENHSGSILLK